MTIRRRAIPKIATAALLLLSLSASACLVAGPRYGVGASFRVAFAPPPLRDEVIIERPGPDHVWVGGHWEWMKSRRDYVWEPGRWMRPPRAHSVWVPPHFETRGHDSYYVSGYWRHE